MKYFCETELSSMPHFFVSAIKPNNTKIKVYQLKADKNKIIDLEKNIAILNSASFSPSTHNLLFIYMTLADLCLEEMDRMHFNERASSIALNQIESLNLESDNTYYNK